MDATAHDPLYGDTSAGHERALVGALSLRGHDAALINEHRRRSRYLKTRDQLAEYIAGDPAPSPIELAQLAALLIGGAR